MKAGLSIISLGFITVFFHSENSFITALFDSVFFVGQMGLIISLVQSKKSLSEREEPTMRCPSSLSCGSVLDLDNNLFICNLVKDDPNGYSSRVYYRSGLGTGVPFTWEAEPGKPKTNSMEESDFIVVTPPPSFEGDKKLALLQVRNKDRGSKSCRIPCASVACIPFSTSPKNS